MSLASANDLTNTSIKTDYVLFKISKSKDFLVFVYVTNFVTFEKFSYRLIQCANDPKHNRQKDTNKKLKREDFDSDFEYRVCEDDTLPMFIPMMEMCTKEVRETCIGFVVRQYKIFIHDAMKEKNVTTIPRCLQPFLSNNGQYAKSAPTTMTIFSVFATMWWMNFY